MSYRGTTLRVVVSQIETVMTLILPILLTAAIGSWLFSAAFLSLVARWLKATKATFWRSAALVLAMSVIGGAVSFLSFRAAEAFGGQPSGLKVSLAFLGVSVILVAIFCMMIGAILGTTIGRAFAIWLIHAIASCAIAAGLVVLLKSFVVNAYIQPTNNMAPTIVGWHRTDVCPHCQGKLIVPALEPASQFFEEPGWERFGICSNCLKTHKLKSGGAPASTPDRILVSYLAKPERWDIIVFRYPREPQSKWVFRLVGLPGETLYIKDGAVWINDMKLEPPEELKGLKYTTMIGGDFREGKGSPEDPIKLGPSECCVLGDFPESSSDSRDWGPVPMENVEAVVCGVYWPWTRWKVLRH